MRTDKLAVCHTKSTPETDTHCTPKAFIEALEAYLEIKFNLDAAATPKNTVCKKFLTKEDDALSVNWNGTVWCNPPYSKAYEFVRHASKQKSVVMLLAARTDTNWWYTYASRADHIIFIKGRLKFKGAKAGAPFPSILLVFGSLGRSVAKNLYWAPTPYERGFSRGQPKEEL